MKEQGAALELAVDREHGASVLLALIFVLALPLTLASSSRIFNDGDVSWHIAAGQWIIAHHHIPIADPFSYTAAGHPWVVTEWLADAIFGLVFSADGYRGVSVIVGAALIALHGAIYFYLQRRASPIATVSALLLMDFVLIPFAVARPHVLVWPLLASWTILLLDADERERAPPYWAALILTLWTNIHGSFLLAAPIGAAIAFDALQKTKWTNWRHWAWFALASAAAMLLNANGMRGLIRPFEMEHLALLPLVQEWQPSTLHWTPQFYVVLGIGIFAMLCRGVRVPPGRLLLLLGLAALAFSQVRHQSWFAIVAACVAPPLLGGEPSVAIRRRWFALAAVLLLLVRAILPIVPAENVANPRQLIAAVPASLRGQPMFNDYTFGGPMILAGMRPYIDGRADMYGDAFVLNYSRIIDGDLGAFDAAVRHYGIRWTMLPNRSALNNALDRSPEWRRAYADRVGTIHVRQDGSR
jgi:hypothetical protein